MGPISLSLFILLSSTVCRAERLRVVTIESAPLYMRSSGGAYEGFLVDLIADLVDRLNRHPDTQDVIRYETYLTPDGLYGMQNERGDWNGLMGQLITGDADMILAPLTVTKIRNEHVEFSHPFMSVVVVPLIKKPTPGSPMPFNDLSDLTQKVSSGQLTVGYVQYGSTETFLSKHKLESVQLMYNATKVARAENPYVNDYNQGVSRVRSSNGRFVFYGEHLSFDEVSTRQPCDLMVAWQASVGVRYYALAFRRTPAGRQWAERFQDALLRAEEDGTIAKLKHRWWDERADCPRTSMCVCAQ